MWRDASSQGLDTWEMTLEDSKAASNGTFLSHKLSWSFLCCLKSLKASYFRCCLIYKSTLASLWSQARYVHRLHYTRISSGPKKVHPKNDPNLKTKEPVISGWQTPPPQPPPPKHEINSNGPAGTVKVLTLLFIDKQGVLLHTYYCIHVLYLRIKNRKWNFA